ncbi:hypothetical protein SCP_1402180 [Sparassis crispa]|uniref:Uncharacterized protein n=1 Tax=Sparassis crispa TaxID=139825 RepID=A0A401H337_9APHY|nr:hypothetical protein SCP_1402180 [Sparassis crispa]GBE88813.1 hypothetical protein SCP_1402180 [Sparassis crispa]
MPGGRRDSDQTPISALKPDEAGGFRQRCPEKAFINGFALHSTGRPHTAQRNRTIDLHVARPRTYSRAIEYRHDWDHTRRHSLPNQT